MKFAIKEVSSAVELRSLQGVYLLTNTHNGKRYVGQSFGKGGLRERFRTHLYKLNKGKHPNVHLQAAWPLYAVSFVCEILRICPIEEGDYWEEFYIEKFKSDVPMFGYNIRRGPNCSKNISEATKAKISQALTGKKQSDETRAKRSESMQGKNSGKCHSEETKRKMKAVRGHGSHMTTEGRARVAKATTARWKDPEKRERTTSKISEANKGRVPFCKGKLYYTDGTTNIMLPSEEHPPEGYRRGRTQMAMRRITDGVCVKEIPLADPIPFGWHQHGKKGQQK